MRKHTWAHKEITNDKNCKIDLVLLVYCGLLSRLNSLSVLSLVRSRVVHHCHPATSWMDLPMIWRPSAAFDRQDYYRYSSTFFFMINICYFVKCTHLT